MAKVAFWALESLKVDTEFWLECWQQPVPGFHLDAVHPLLPACWARVSQPQHQQVLVPLCGKSIDMYWLQQQLPVLGIELAKRPCHEFFIENRLAVNTDLVDGFIAHRGETVCILQGDFFQLSAEQLQGPCLVYDRAALIALPKTMRQHYVRHLRKLLPAGSTILLLSLEYPPAEKQGPPFTVSAAEIRQLFDGCQLELLAIRNLTGQGFARRTFATSFLLEKAWRIQC
ncbi:class I SAM-dependent methyltransferase [Alkalimonas mucilaginosa]|uniref:Thiopurine S-methyltransferase n=1 Tax=Alkalimonas mucilaginosa TaxID=3057676 RepID=A0ABU7JJG0_9GAMM|nr:thiopurine S-methyltransferase [Alkalimonas sp. MEB004]MEE2025625.1 thiopurine S-methyltransferase [Alkalimonas sp. MEB004]